MMTCQVCGDQNGPFEYQEYKSANGKPWLIEDGTIVLACEDCAKIIKKKNNKTRKTKQKKQRTLAEQITYKGGIK